LSDQADYNREFIQDRGQSFLIVGLGIDHIALAEHPKKQLPRCLAWVVTTVRAWQPMFFGSVERRFSVPA
jgi:hypothetical protein